MRRLEMDNPTGCGSFYHILSLYHKLASTVVGVGLTLGIAAAVVHIDIAAILLVSSAVLAFLWIVWLTWCYERYLHTRKPYDITSPKGPSSYTEWHYMVTIMLVWFILLTFVLGLAGGLLGLLGE